MGAKQENSALGKGKRCFKERKTMLYEKREIELQEEVMNKIPIAIFINPGIANSSNLNTAG